MEIANSKQGLMPVLANSAFRKLWAAQWLAQSAQNTIHFVLIVLIERMTGSSIQQGLVIFAFTLPAIIFAPISGVIIDRWPKKYILMASNLLRVLIICSYFAVLGLRGHVEVGWLLLALYVITFTMSTIGQFFNPAEAATIPILVQRDNLIAANSLFNLTLALSQVVGLIILGPLAVKLFGTESAFILVAGMYVLAALLVSRLPKDTPTHVGQAARGAWNRAWDELKEGAAFVWQRPPVMLTMAHLTLIASLVMVMAMLAPGIANRVLRLAPEDAMVVFAPAGLGMLLAALILGRMGNRTPRQRTVRYGLVAMTAGFAAFGLFSWRMMATGQGFVLDSSVIALPPASAALILSIVLISLVIGLSMSSVNIVSQTALQDGTPERLRGRVFAVQFMLNNLVGIPPMLAVAGLADLIGIPQVLLGVSLAVFGVLLVTVYMQRRLAITAALAVAAENKEESPTSAAPSPTVAKPEAAPASESARVSLDQVPAID
ncbi:MAG: MFS transporter [Caldilineae bacterium]|nr:MFS transporter [Anaerolineae bacterium]MCB0198747.1 MFS transporter [Anaerolineae bacterium]MCB0253505.1 MFS transporter [Anaerolineae bacterium]MCB9155311.1 MFS transporter [Caldilineae bacterium]